jgi:hypothetical protein
VSYCTDDNTRDGKTILNLEELVTGMLSPTTIPDQKILACPTCGTPNGNCDPSPCRDGIVMMTKARAANLALVWAFRDEEPEVERRRRLER